MSRSGNTSSWNRLTKDDDGAGGDGALVDPPGADRQQHEGAERRAGRRAPPRTAARMRRHPDLGVAQLARRRRRSAAPRCASAPRAFTTRAPSKLSWATADTWPSRSWASSAGSVDRPLVARRSGATRAGNTVKPTSASHRSVASSHATDSTTITITPVEYGSGLSTSAAASTSLPAWDSSSPVGVRAVEGVRHLLVAAHDLLAQRGLDAGAGDRGRRPGARRCRPP